MLYLITDENNKSWRETQWGENVSHTEDNPNYHFPVFQDILVASYMYPAYDFFEKPKIWEATTNTDPTEISFRSKYPQLTTIKEVQFVNPTIEQRITFALLCSLNLILNPTFREWALNYLKGIDQTKETAHKVSELLCDQLNGTGTYTQNEAGDWSPTGKEIPMEYQYFDCAHPALAAIMLEQPQEFAANTAHRAYFDAVDKNIPFNLQNFAYIANLVPAAEIAKILE